MIVTILTVALTCACVGGMLFVMGCGCATLGMAVAHKAIEHKRVKLERKYLCQFEHWCIDHSDELTDCEVVNE